MRVLWLTKFDNASASAADQKLSPPDNVRVYRARRRPAVSTTFQFQRRWLYALQ